MKGTMGTSAATPVTPSVKSSFPEQPPKGNFGGRSVTTTDLTPIIPRTSYTNENSKGQSLEKRTIFSRNDRLRMGIRKKDSNAATPNSKKPESPPVTNARTENSRQLAFSNPASSNTMPFTVLITAFLRLSTRKMNLCNNK